MELEYFTQEETKGQHRNPKWHAARKGRLTASKFYEICHCKFPQKLCWKYKNPDNEEIRMRLPAVMYGMDLEPYIFQQVKEYFMRVERLEVTECGLFIHPEYSFLGASPDGLIGDRTVLEIKCPYSVINCEKLPPYLKKNKVTGLYDLDHKHPYYYQVQGEMMCSQREYAILAVYHRKITGDQIYLSCVNYNHVFCENMKKQLIEFYKCFTKEINTE